jgi:hypothetical protein
LVNFLNEGQLSGVSGHSAHTGHFSAAGHGWVNKFGKNPKNGPMPFWATRRNRESQKFDTKLTLNQNKVGLYK